jgi:MORN repeat
MGNNSSSENEKDKNKKNNNNAINFDKYLVGNDEIENCYGGEQIGGNYFGMICYKNKNNYYGPWRFVKDKVILEGSEGTMTFNDGTEYKGSWVNGKYDGHGRMDLYTGASYDGEWRAGKRHGNGIMTYEDGTVVNDGWDNGVRIKHVRDKYHDYDP